MFELAIGIGYIDTIKPKETLTQFDIFLAECGLVLDAIIIGGTALALLGVISRQTRDCDVLHPELPEVIKEAATAFATQVRQQGEVLADDWLNNGPSLLADVLPDGWRGRIQIAFSGRALSLSTLGRMDLLRSKLFALCDRGTDLPDCLALAPSQEELEVILPWLEQQDANPDWPAHVGATLQDLHGRLSHGV